jgi:hypothetical protein
VDAAVFIVYLCVVLAGQYLSHATQLGFGAYPDEPSHYVTGLMVHDYLLSGMKESPLAYARSYYSYIPLLGIGHWPPLFYAVEAGWMLLAGTGRGGLLIPIALIAALLTFLLYAAAVSEIGRLCAFLTASWLLFLPVVRWSDDLVMVDTFAALTVVAATISFGRYLDSERTRDAVLFGILAGLAFLSKPVAICLVLVPPIAVALTGKYRLVRKFSFWLPAPIVLAMAGPWYLYTLPMALYGQSKTGFREFAAAAVPIVLRQTWHELGFLMLLSVVGLAVWVRRGKAIAGRTASLAALPAALLVALVAAHVDHEARHLIPGLAPLIVAAGVGAWWPLSWLGARTGYKWMPLAGFLVCTVAVIAQSRLPKLVRSDDGVAQLAAQLLDEAPKSGFTVLVAGASGSSEGRLIAEIAHKSPARPHDAILRATKLLATIDWNAESYHPLCQTPAEALDVLDRSGAQFLALDVSDRWSSNWSHYYLLRQLPRLYPDRFREIGSFPAGTQASYLLYRLEPEVSSGAHPEAMREKLDEKLAPAKGRAKPR